MTNKLELLKDAINKNIDTIDENLNIKDFAQVVAEILIDDYGQLNYDKFIKVLKEHLK